MKLLVDKMPNHPTECPFCKTEENYDDKKIYYCKIKEVISYDLTQESNGDPYGDDGYYDSGYSYYLKDTTEKVECNCKECQYFKEYPCKSAEFLGTLIKEK